MNAEKWLFVNRRSGKTWETAQAVITDADFIAHLELQDDDRIGCYYMLKGHWRRERESLRLSEGKVQMATPCVRTRQGKAVGA